MLTLSLLRHAKAVPHSRGEDFGRALADKGRADAARLGRHLAASGWRPDLALVSSATRTRQTFDLVLESAKLAVPVTYERSLYSATPGELRDSLKLVAPAIGHLVIVGHNPAIMEAAILLARDGDILALQRLRSHFPPGALAELVFDHGDWLDARASGGRLERLLTPEDLAG